MALILGVEGKHKHCNQLLLLGDTTAREWKHRWGGADGNSNIEEGVGTFSSLVCQTHS